jgi:glycosyltransferase involved in cell wall biosynthesis
MDDPPFEHEIHAFTAVNPDDTLVSQPLSFFGDGEQMWGRRTNNVEYLANAARVYGDLQRSDFDVLHILQLNPIVYPTGTVNQQRPVVIGPDILGWNPVRSGGRWDVAFPDSALPKFKYHAKRLLARPQQYTGATAYSNYHCQILEQLGVPSAKTTRLPPGIDPIFSVDDAKTINISEPPELLYVGDISEHKGFPEFIAAIQQLDREVTVTVIGAGSAAGTSAEILPYVSIKGFVDRADLPEYYRRADLYVMPSIDEAGPNTIIEALACGTPVVATDKIGVNEFPPADASVLFWPREADPLTEALETALDGLPALTAAARSQAEEFHVDRTIDHLAEFYHELLGRTD